MRWFNKSSKPLSSLYSRWYSATADSSIIVRSRSVNCLRSLGWRNLSRSVSHFACAVHRAVRIGSVRRIQTFREGIMSSLVLGKGWDKISLIWAFMSMKGVYHAKR